MSVCVRDVLITSYLSVCYFVDRIHLCSSIIPECLSTHSNSSPSPPVSKRPLQREESDASEKAKIVMSSEGNRSGSNSLTREQYDSIFKLREQHGILTDRQTREKVLSKQSKEAAAKEQRLHQGTMNSDIQSDFDTVSSLSLIHI